MKSSDSNYKKLANQFSIPLVLARDGYRPCQASLFTKPDPSWLMAPQNKGLVSPGTGPDNPDPAWPDWSSLTEP